MLSVISYIIMLGVVMLSVVAPYYSGKGITFKTNPYPLSKDAAKSNYLDKTSLLIFPLFDGVKSMWQLIWLLLFSSGKTRDLERSESTERSCPCHPHRSPIPDQMT